MSKQRIVILGGGFGGIYTALHLEKLLKKAEFEIHLVNKDNYFVYQPMLAEVVGGSIGLLDTVNSIRKLLPKTELYVRDIDSIDLQNKCVNLAPNYTHKYHVLEYDHLVLALGNVTDFHDNPGLHQHALPFKNLADAIVIRNRIIDAVENASYEKDPETRRKMLNFVVGGGGFSGTEVVAELNDFARKLAKRFPSIQEEEIKVYLIHSKDRLLEREMNDSLGRYAGKLLKKRGVEILFNRRLVSASPEDAVLDDGSRIPSFTIISSVPSSPNPLIETLDLPKVKGRIKTDGSMLVEGQSNVWAIGDCAMIPLVKTKEMCPPTAQFAVRQGKRLAKNICASLGSGNIKPFHFKALGMLGALGHHSAVAELFGVFKFSGFFAWLMWRAIYWAKLPGVSRKVKVALSWLVDAILPGEAVQLELSPSQGIAQLHFEKDEVIFHEGDIGDFLYIITEGQVEILQKRGNEELRLAILGKGEFFGEMALLNQRSRTATVKAITPVNVLAMKKTDFGALIANLSELRESFEKAEKKRREDLEQIQKNAIVHKQLDTLLLKKQLFQSDYRF